MKFTVVWRDGSLSENLSHEESMRLIEMRDGEWASVRFSENSRDRSEENSKRKEAMENEFRRARKKS